MRVLWVMLVAVALLVAGPPPAGAATRGECEAGLKRLEESEPNVRPQFRRKFEQQRRKAQAAQKREDWDGCAAAAAEALTPGRPTPPAPR